MKTDTVSAPAIYAGLKYPDERTARWAVFFDLCRLDHAESTEQFTGSGGACYRPAFWLPAFKMFVAVETHHDVWPADLWEQRLLRLSDMAASIMEAYPSLEQLSGLLVLCGQPGPGHGGVMMGGSRPLAARFARCPACEATGLWLHDPHAAELPPYTRELPNLYCPQPGCDLYAHHVAPHGFRAAAAIQADDGQQFGLAGEMIKACLWGLGGREGRA